MRSKALKLSQKRYRNKMKQINLTVTPEEKEHIAGLAKEKGESITLYIKKAIMSKEKEEE